MRTQQPVRKAGRLVQVLTPSDEQPANQLRVFNGQIGVKPCRLWIITETSQEARPNREKHLLREQMGALRPSIHQER
jgi:hypothetical protein